MLKTKLKDELIIAMKDKNQLRVSTLRMSTYIQEAQLEAERSG